MLLGCHTAVNPQVTLTLLLLSNYMFYKPMFALGICRAQMESKGLIYLLFIKYSEMPHKEIFTSMNEIKGLQVSPETGSDSVVYRAASREGPVAVGPPELLSSCSLPFRGVQLRRPDRIASVQSAHP
jgi:hypothetical protein